MLRPEGSPMLQCCSYCALFFLGRKHNRKMAAPPCTCDCVRYIAAQPQNISKQKCISAHTVGVGLQLSGQMVIVWENLHYSHCIYERFMLYFTIDCLSVLFNTTAALQPSQPDKQDCKILLVTSVSEPICLLVFSDTLFFFFFFFSFGTSKTAYFTSSGSQRRPPLGSPLSHQSTVF